MYIEAAARWLAPHPNSRFVVCQSRLAVDRIPPAASAAGLLVLRRLDVIPRTGKPVLFCVLVLRRRRGDDDVVECEVESVCVRTPSGEHTPEYRRLLQDLDKLPPDSLSRAGDGDGDGDVDGDDASDDEQ